jgi:hypothetical protein
MSTVTAATTAMPVTIHHTGYQLLTRDSTNQL